MQRSFLFVVTLGLTVFAITSAQADPVTPSDTVICNNSTSTVFENVNERGVFRLALPGWQQQRRQPACPHVQQLIATRAARCSGRTEQCRRLVAGPRHQLRLGAASRDPGRGGEPDAVTDLSFPARPASSTSAGPCPSATRGTPFHSPPTFRFPPVLEHGNLADTVPLKVTRRPRAYARRRRTTPGRPVAGRLLAQRQL